MATEKKAARADQSKTIQQFCDVENISLASYYAIRRKGHAPTELRVPGTDIIRITPEAHADWRARMAEFAVSEEAALERQRRVAQRSAAGKRAALARHGDAA
jgi:hypothetical protein